MAKTTIAALVAAAALVAGCSKSAPSTSTKPSISAAAVNQSAAPVSPAASPTTASATPLAFYASQYLADGKACMAAQDVLHNAPNSATGAQLQVMATNIVKACQAANAVILRQSWPANVLADLRAEVTADGPVFGDLTDMLSNSGSLLRDSGIANAAANLVRADLGLPPVS
jgi:hypothetical protein